MTVNLICINNGSSYVDERESRVSSLAPCSGSCPAHVDIPGYIALCKEGRFAEAKDLIRKDNPLPSICGRICVHPCTITCRRAKAGGAISIREIKRSVTDAPFTPVEKAESTGKKIAVIGGGPCGLTAAWNLLIMGHEVTIFEEMEKLGGMMRYGIPRYRLPEDVLDQEIADIVSYGAEVKTGTRIGRDISIKELEESYDKVVVAIGDQKDKKCGIENEDAEGVIPAVEFLRELGERKRPDLRGKKIVVIGGGNVAMDALRSSVRLGAEKVTCAYRRAVEQMPADKEEIEDAIEEGVIMDTLQAPYKAEVDENGRLTALITTPQRLVPDEKGGRPRPVPAEGAEPHRIECDILIAAIGQSLDETGFEEAGIPTHWGRIVTGENYEIGEQIYAGGDAVKGPDTVINAVAHGKAIAYAVDKALGYDHRIVSKIEIPAPGMPVKDNTKNTCEKSDPEVRRSTWEEVEHDLGEEALARECARCLRCDRPLFAKKK